METPGGGGFGPASERSADAAERDRRHGLVS
jgi:N-methylhydantoinase B/oxoprolinase/acetone carboxylase alpha subunit